MDAKLIRTLVVALMVIESGAAAAQETALSVDGFSLMRLSRKQSTRPDAFGVYERSLELLGPTDGSQEMGSSRLYGSLYLMGDSYRASMGIGPALALHSSFPNASDNRAFYVVLGDQHNVAAGKGDVVFHSWDSSFTQHVMHMVLKPNGDVGIGTVDPAYRLHVNGPAAAVGFVNLSSRSFKRDVTDVGAEEQRSMLAQLMNLNVARYRYRKEIDPHEGPRIGFIAEEMPAEVLSDDGKGVDVYQLLTLAIASMQVQQQQIVELERKVAALKAAEE